MTSPFSTPAKSSPHMVDSIFFLENFFYKEQNVKLFHSKEIKIENF